MPRLLIAAIALISPVILLATPASAQDPGEKVNQLIVYGDDPCPPSTGDEITVCARKDEAERYRIPEALRGSESPQNDAWNNKVLAYETVGAAGPLSCSPVGPGGALGCTQRLVDAAYAEKRQGTDVKFSELIQAEREKRLSTIDADAAEQQKRVEEAEKAYEAREKARQNAGVAAPQSPSDPRFRAN